MGYRPEMSVNTLCNHASEKPVSLDEVVLTLNEPELHEGLSNDRYTAEKTIGKRRIYLYYYQTLPLQAHQNELYAIIDFVGFSDL